MDDSAYDVVVIGAGVFGAWAAYQLQRSGRRVLLLDAHGAGNNLSSSGDESRIMRMGYGADEVYSRSAQRSLTLWQEFSAKVGETLFHQTGVLWLARADDPYPVKSYETLTRLGVPVERLGVDETQKRFPQLNLDGIAWTMLEPESGALMARRAVQAVVRESVRRGVEFLEERVRRIRTKDHLSEILTTGRQRISAETFVFACGAWLPKLFRELADRIHPTRQEVFYFETPPEQFSPPNLPVWIDFSNEAYGLPNLEGHGVKVAIDRHGKRFDPDTGDRHPSPAGVAETRRYLVKRVPALKEAPQANWHVCQYENTSNGDFLIDRHPDFENVWLVGGGSGHGFKHGPFVGEYVAARIAGETKGIEPRFSLATKTPEQRRSVY